MSKATRRASSVRNQPEAAASGWASTPWTEQIGESRGDIVTAWERPDKGGVVYLRWTNPATGAYSKCSTHIVIRDAAGDVVEHRVTKVRALAKAKQASVRQERALRALGVAASDTPAPVARPAAASSLTPSTDIASASMLTLRTGIADAMQLRTGVFAAETSHARDTRALLARVLTILNPDLPFDALTTNHYRALWRGLADQYRTELERITVARREAAQAGSKYDGPTRPTGGRVSAERAVIALVRVARWLADGGRLQRGSPNPPLQWKHRLAEDWRQITGQSTPAAEDVERPRYTTVEMGRLLEALPQADPRLRLAVELAGEARLGAVVQRAMRSALDLREGKGALGHGMLTITGAGKKPGVTVHLDAQQRARVDHDMTEGYLRDLEAAYRAGHLLDYPLIPAGRLKQGRARTTATGAMDDRTLKDLWRDLEELAGVPSVSGRGFYGYRRTATDLAEDVEPDQRALRALFGHKAGEMRGDVYQNAKRIETAVKVAKARRRIREIALQAARDAAAAAGDAASAGSRAEVRAAATDDSAA